MRRVFGGGGVQTVRKGPWTPEEDAVLIEHVRNNGARNWSLISFLGQLPRTGKSCRLRWVNKLRPGLKKGRKFAPEEEQRILELQSRFGNRWATIAKYFPGRTDNDVKNFWSIHRKRLARAQRCQKARLAGISNPALNLETEEVSVAALQELHASEKEAQGSNSKGNSGSAASSDVLDPQPDVNPTSIDRDSDQLSQQPIPFDGTFDLPPLPEMQILQPATACVNPGQHQSGQLPQFLEPKPEVEPTDLTQLNWEQLFPDSGLGTHCLDSVPFYSPQPGDFDDFGSLFDSFDPPPNKFPP